MPNTVAPTSGSQRRPRRRLLIRVVAGLGGAVVLVLGGVAALGYVAFVRAPANTCADFLDAGPDAGTEQVVVAAGASMVHASLGADWVGELRTRWSADGYEFVNAGRNGDTASGLRARLDADVLACGPDAVMLLIGTNDVTDGTPATAYESTVDHIVARLVSGGIRVAVLSLPPIGEDLVSDRNERVRAYNAALAAVAARHGATYLPLHERLVELIQQHRPSGGGAYDFSFPLALRTAFEHYVLRRDWDTIGEGNGLVALTDHTHLTDRSGQILADLVSGWLVTDSGA